MVEGGCALESLEHSRDGAMPRESTAGDGAGCAPHALPLDSQGTAELAKAEAGAEALQLRGRCVCSCNCAVLPALLVPCSLVVYVPRLRLAFICWSKLRQRM